MNNNAFQTVDIESLKKIINNWQENNKPILSNFYGVDEEGVYDVMEGSKTLILRKHEADFYRIYIMSADRSELTTMLSDLDGVDYVINIPSRKPIDDWDELLKQCGFTYYETYSRICNPKVATMKKRDTATGEYAKESDLDDIINLLSENFSLYTAHLPSRESMLQLIREHQIFVDRYPDGKVCGVNIFNVKGPVGYGIAWIDKGEHGLDLQFDMFNHFIDSGVKRLVGWVRDSNTKVVKTHLRMGAVCDGLKDYTYTKLVKK